MTFQRRFFLTFLLGFLFIPLTAKADLKLQYDKDGRGRVRSIVGGAQFRNSDPLLRSIARGQTEVTGTSRSGRPEVSVGRPGRPARGRLIPKAVSNLAQATPPVLGLAPITISALTIFDSIPAMKKKKVADNFQKFLEISGEIAVNTVGNLGEYSPELPEPTETKYKFPNGDNEKGGSGGGGGGTGPSGYPLSRHGNQNSGGQGNDGPAVAEKNTRGLPPGETLESIKKKHGPVVAAILDRLAQTGNILEMDFAVHESINGGPSQKKHLLSMSDSDTIAHELGHMLNARLTPPRNASTSS